MMPASGHGAGVMMPGDSEAILQGYPRGPLEKPPAVDADPGRFRNAAFFAKMYGDCKKGEVSPHLVSIAWLPKTWGKSIRVTSVTPRAQASFQRGSRNPVPLHGLWRDDLSQPGRNSPLALTGTPLLP